MALSYVGTDELEIVNIPPESYTNSSVNSSAVSWGAIFAGAAVAAALSLILLMLGAGLGLTTVSPWANQGFSAATFGISTIVWITVTQILAAGMGGYLAGRLRTKWDGVHSDEVFFRDTAHGFLAWSVATLATAALLTSLIGSIVKGGVQAGAAMAGSATVAAAAVAGDGLNQMDKTGNANASSINEGNYFIDALFRSAPVSSDVVNANPQTDTSQKSASIAEVIRILANSKDNKALPAQDVSYISQLIANNTGLTQQEAENRFNEIYAQMQKDKLEAELAAKTTAEKVRKATIYTTLWLFISLLMVAFSASLAATWGGRSRDT
ncbi:MAG TPA: hypothetical protein VK952_06100 [Methylotenera sp.]|nr:hypothetical protein [Methylotenera sp.]